MKKNRIFNFIDVTGNKYNYLTAIRFSHTQNKNYQATFWLFKCDCGNKIIANISTVKTGGRKSCGCMAGAHRTKDLTNLIFNKLKVLNYSHKNEKGNYIWKCQCNCGNYRYVSSYELTKNKVKSCGCDDSQKKKGKTNPRWKGYEEISGHYWCQLKQNAKVRNLKVEIVLQDIWNLFLKQNRKCIMSGLDISFIKKTASVDRIDSEKDYTLDNIQIVHKDINRIKQYFSKNRFIELCKLVVETESLPFV